MADLDEAISAQERLERERAAEQRRIRAAKIGDLAVKSGFVDAAFTDAQILYLFRRACSASSQSDLPVISETAPAAAEALAEQVA